LATRGVPEAAAGKAEPARAQIDLKTVKPAAAPPVRTTEDFARLIARRLDDGSSEFELRLDPPELGRIEARLIVGDDGETTLAIKFDNQAAYDLFARDDAALRLAFAEAGYDFGRSGLSFSLDDRPRPDAPANVSASTHDAVQRGAYVALVAANALDLRV
ncbi:MAG: flagellar hook-length control protein FliK, partial [Parvularculaceae bacterium]